MNETEAWNNNLSKCTGMGTAEIIICSREKTHMRKTKAKLAQSQSIFHLLYVPHTE